jgi:cyclohexyl-isocyanide hydratase
MKTTTPESTAFRIVIPVYDGVDLMDIAAPREIFGWLAHADFPKAVEIAYVGAREGTFITNNGVIMKIEATFDTASVQQPDLIWVPGGRPDALAQILSNTNSPYIAYLKRVGLHAKWVCSVCEGAVLLAHTGLLNGHEITTHWNFVNCFGKYPEVTVVKGHPRYVKSGNRVTGGGISSGLDQAIYLVELIAGTASAVKVQRMMQYYPKPPVSSTIPNAGSCPVHY